MKNLFKWFGYISFKKSPKSEVSFGRKKEPIPFFKYRKVSSSTMLLQNSVKNSRLLERPLV